MRKKKEVKSTTFVKTSLYWLLSYKVFIKIFKTIKEKYFKQVSMLFSN